MRPAGPGQTFYLPPASVLSGVVALMALALTSGGYALPGALGVLLAATYLTPARLPASPWLAWLLRALAFGAVLFLDPGPATGSVDWPISAGVLHWVALMAGAELVLQSWRESHSLGPGGIAALPLTAVVFMAACNTLEPGHVRYTAALYVLCLLFALRHYRPRGGEVARYAAPGLAAALAGAVALGAGTHWVLRTYVRGVDQWAAELLAGRVRLRQTGFAATPRLGDSFDLQQSSERVLRIQGLDAAGGPTHLRGMAYVTYHEGAWLPAMDEVQYSPADGDSLRPDAPGPRAAVTRLVNTQDLLFLPLETAGVRVPEESEPRWSPEAGYSVRAGGRPLLPFTYSFIGSAAGARPGPLSAPPDDSDRLRLLGVPPGLDVRVQLLARRVGVGAGSPEARIRAVENYLLANHAYSLKIRSGPGDPVAEFLLNRKAAHCQYFASAATLLLRCLGVPARYVQGYYAHEGGGPGVTVVRGRDAHAWAEAWVEGKGWVTVDATPGSGRPDALAGGVPGWRRAWERLHDLYLGAMAWLAARSPAEWGLVVVGLLAVLVLFPLARQLRAGRRAGTAGNGYSPAAPELAEAASRFERLLAGTGLPCPPHRTWEEHLAALPGEAPLDRRAAAGFVQEYYRARFGGAGDPSRLSELLDRLEKAGASPAPGRAS